MYNDYEYICNNYTFISLNKEQYGVKIEDNIMNYIVILIID